MSLVKKCPRCGARLGGNNRYCGKCGCDTEEGVGGERAQEPRIGRTPRPVETARTFPRQESARETWSTEASPYADRDRGFFSVENWKIALVIAAAVIVLVLAIVLVIRVTSRPKTAELPPVSVSETAEPSPEASEPVHVIAAGDELATPTPSAAPEPTRTPAPATAAPTPTGPVINEASGVAYAVADQVNIYAGPGRDYEIIGTAERDEELVRTGVTDGWTRVEYNGREGFVLNSDLTLTQPTPTPTASPVPADYPVDARDDTVTVIGTTANLRRGPGLDFEVAANVPAGTQLHRTGSTNGWSQVSYNGETLYISEDLVQPEATATPAPTQAPDPTQTPAPTETPVNGGESETVTLAMNANVRSGPGTEYEVLGLVEGGATLPTSGLEGEWYRVTFNGQTGYVFAELVE